MNDYTTDDSGYKDRYVAFLDILGFSTLTEKADQHPNWRAWLRDCISALKQTVPEKNEAIGFRFVQFSDSIVMSVDRTTEGLSAILGGVQLLYHTMLSRQVLLRGGIAAGNFHHDDHLMFGPALIRAYAFEQNGAPPHVSLHPSVLEDMKPSLINPQGFMGCQTCDPWDGTPMVHVLWDFAFYDGIPREGMVPLEYTAWNFARFIEHNASDSSLPPGALAKWRWLQHYWNSTVAPKAVLQLSGPNIDYDLTYSQIETGMEARRSPGTNISALAQP